MTPSGCFRRVPAQLEGELSRGTWALLSASPAALDLFGPLPSPQTSEQQGSEAAGAGRLAQPAAAAAAAQYEGRMWARLLG